MTGGPGKEHRNNKLPPTRRVQERSKGDTTCPTTSQNPSLWHPSWLNKVSTTRKVSDSEWLAKDDLETNPMIMKPETACPVSEQFSWVSLPYCSPPGFPFPIKSLALSAHVSPWTIHFQVLDKSPVSGPGRAPPSCNNTGGFSEVVGKAAVGHMVTNEAMENCISFDSQYFSVLRFSVLILIICCDLRNWFSDPVRRWLVVWRTLDWRIL